MLYDPSKPFKILSIDGGGIRGIYPAKFLTELEFQLEKSGKKITYLNQYFDLICGTSTGGIIALGLALGMTSNEILSLYRDHANNIFGRKKGFWRSLFNPSHNSDYLENLLKRSFSVFTENGDTRLGHAKTRVCIPVYNGYYGRVSVLKTSHHQDLMRDYQYPAHDVALSTSSAPFYFKPHSFKYKKVGEADLNTVTNNIDGGIFANNPALIGLLEAVQTLQVPIDNLKILSIGTGMRKFKESEKNNGWGSQYWAISENPRIIELIFSSQSDDINNTIKFLNQGVGTSSKPRFTFKRVQFEFNNQDYISLDETNPEKLGALAERASNDFQIHGKEIVDEFCSQIITPYTPQYAL
ncbi:MAG: patatin-like phospholipase family protein [Balneolales bacterium]|nr:patatin-like phospholipase family protein [Balneolales bacterium]